MSRTAAHRRSSSSDLTRDMRPLPGPCPSFSEPVRPWDVPADAFVRQGRGLRAFHRKDPSARTTTPPAFILDRVTRSFRANRRASMRVPDGRLISPPCRERSVERLTVRTLAAQRLPAPDDAEGGDGPDAELMFALIDLIGPRFGAATRTKTSPISSAPRFEGSRKPLCAVHRPRAPTTAIPGGSSGDAGAPAHGFDRR